ncbi:MAG: two-component system response regulator GlrR [Hyphomicrobiaceae bacterium]|jgi:two-component system response regulator GlrR
MYAETHTLSIGEGYPANGSEAPRPEPSAPDHAPDPTQHLIGTSPSFVAVTRKIPLLADCDATILITGETGTGKELAAEAVHFASTRHGKPFIPVNCGAIPEELVENELFGHTKGAYTGAGSNGRGLLAEAEGGTLFLDELNSLSLSAQSKLLRFLQNREFRMLGSTKIQHADVRIIAATNCDLRELVRAGKFREDLYHRLHVLALQLPPLRDRHEDIPLLADHFVDLYGRLAGRGVVRLSDSAHAKLAAHRWSGNVRELQSVIQRSVLLTSRDVLEADDIDLCDMSEAPFGVEKVAEEHSAYVPNAVTAHIGADLAGETFREAKDRVIREFEMTYLWKVLADADGNVTHAARIAGMQRRDLQRLLRKHDLRRDQIAA